MKQQTLWIMTVTSLLFLMALSLPSYLIETLPLKMAEVDVVNVWSPQASTTTYQQDVDHDEILKGNHQQQQQPSSQSATLPKRRQKD